MIHHTFISSLFKWPQNVLFNQRNKSYVGTLSLYKDSSTNGFAFWLQIAGLPSTTLATCQTLHVDLHLPKCLEILGSVADSLHVSTTKIQPLRKVICFRCLSRNFNHIEKCLVQNQTQWTCQLIRRHQSETQCQAIWHALTQKN